MRPTYEHVLGKRYRPKKRYPKLLMREVIPTRVYYDYPRRLPWEPIDPHAVKHKYVEFVFMHESKQVTERYDWYAFFRYFEKVEDA